MQLDRDSESENLSGAQFPWAQGILLTEEVGRGDGEVTAQGDP